VATPLPDTVPSRNPASVTDRPAARASLPRDESRIQDKLAALKDDLRSTRQDNRRND